MRNTPMNTVKHRINRKYMMRITTTKMREKMKRL